MATLAKTIEAGADAAVARSRLGELDAFRGLAALWVVLFHLVLRYQELLAVDMPLWLRPVFVALAGQGLFGVLPVTWFFMISGFVIERPAMQAVRAAWRARAADARPR